MKKLLTTTFFLILLFLFFNPSRASAAILNKGDIVALKSCANNKYVCAENTGANSLIADRDSASTDPNSWEAFQVVDLGSGKVALKSCANGKYICAENTGANPLIANRDSISHSPNSWETFRAVDLGGWKLALKSCADNRYVCADNAGAGSLIANRDSASNSSGSWEAFQVVHLTGQFIVNYAKGFIGTPYVYGGNTPDGFDCSGFVEYVYKHFNIYVPRTSQEQFLSGISVSTSDIQPGDLLFFYGNPPGHVTIYVGNGLMIESPRKGFSVRIIPVHDGLVGARRIVY